MANNPLHATIDRIDRCLTAINDTIIDLHHAHRNQLLAREARDAIKDRLHECFVDRKQLTQWLRDHQDVVQEYRRRQSQIHATAEAPTSSPRKREQPPTAVQQFQVRDLVSELLALGVVSGPLPSDPQQQHEYLLTMINAGIAAIIAREQAETPETTRLLQALLKQREVLRRCISPKTRTMTKPTKPKQDAVVQPTQQQVTSVEMTQVQADALRRRVVFIRQRTPPVFERVLKTPELARAYLVELDAYLDELRAARANHRLPDDLLYATVFLLKALMAERIRVLQAMHASTESSVSLSAFARRQKSQAHTVDSLASSACAVLPAPQTPTVSVTPAKHVHWKVLGGQDGRPRSFRDVMHFVREQQARSTTYTYDEARLQRLHDLNPTNIYVGKEEFAGYIVFVFRHADVTILECALIGNALYALHGDWQLLARKSKSELLQEKPGVVTRIIHAGDWFPKVQALLIQSLDDHGTGEHTRPSRLRDAS